MKRLDELGVSPAPWKKEQTYWVADAHGNAVADCYRNNENVAEVEADARFIAAAPELYEALREAVAESCHNCGAYDRDHGDRCGQADGSCFVQRWRKALEKAGGRE